MKTMGKSRKNHIVKKEDIKSKCMSKLKKIWTDIQHDGAPLIKEASENRYRLH